MGSLSRDIRRALHVVALVAVSCLFWALTLVAGANGSPAGRFDEMVSPSYKAGYGVAAITAAAPDGESVAFESLGVFADAPHGANVGYFDVYLARRENGPEWSTVPTIAPATIAPFSESTDFSASLGLQLAETTLGPNNGNALNEGTEAEFLLHASGTPDAAQDWNTAGGLVLERIDEEAVTPL